MRDQDGHVGSRTWHVVQHEGFHQFVFAVIRGEIPTWVNEGLAVLGHARLGGPNDQGPASLFMREWTDTLHGPWQIESRSLHCSRFSMIDSLHESIGT